jgi:hypothetical protein
MPTTDSVFHQALSKMLTEIFDGPPLSVLNRWAAGDANAWTGVDWNACWQRASVTDAEWRALRDALRAEADAWKKAVTTRTSWDAMSASAALSTAAHTAYHIGAIRQILAGL